MESKNGKQYQKNRFESLLPTHEPTFQQGHVGDLHTKSKVELEELLQRQEKLLMNKGFIKKLPDQGAKLLLFSSNLRKRLTEIEETENITKFDIAQKEKSDTESRQYICTDDTSDEHEVSTDPNKVATGQVFSENNLSIIERDFTDLAIHEGPHYRVVKTAAERPRKSKFTLNRQVKQSDKKTSSTLASSDVKSLLRCSNLYSKKETKVSPLKVKCDKASTSVLSSATITDPKKKAVVISVEECRDLHNKQQEILKEQQNQHAVEQFVSKYGMKFPTSSQSYSVHSEGLCKPILEQIESTDDEESSNDVTLEDVLDVEDVD